MTEPRTRAASAAAANGAEGIDLTVLQRFQELLTQPTPAMDRGTRHVFKSPKFSGKGDVEYFIRQFCDVADANDWGCGAARLHLRAALKDTATDCGQADSVDGIFTALRARFGMTASQARTRIISLKRENRTTLQEHATEVTRLVNLAYEDLSGEQRQTMAKDLFQTTIGNPYLQRHLLAVRAHTMEEAMQAGNEYLQVQHARAPGAVIRNITQEEEMDEIKEVSTKPEVVDPMQLLVQAMGKLVDQMAKWTEPQGRTTPNERTTPNGRTTPAGSRTIVCFGCGKVGHTRRECYANQWNSPRTDTKNVSSPQQ